MHDLLLMLLAFKWVFKFDRQLLQALLVFPLGGHNLHETIYFVAVSVTTVKNFAKDDLLKSDNAFDSLSSSSFSSSSVSFDVGLRSIATSAFINMDMIAHS